MERGIPSAQGDLQTPIFHPNIETIFAGNAHQERERHTEGTAKYEGRHTPAEGPAKYNWGDKDRQEASRDL